MGGQNRAWEQIYCYAKVTIIKCDLKIYLPTAIGKWATSKFHTKKTPVWRTEDF